MHVNKEESSCQLNTAEKENAVNRGRLLLGAAYLFIAIGFVIYLATEGRQVSDSKEVHVEVQKQPSTEREFLLPIRRGDLLVWEDNRIIVVDQFFLATDRSDSEFLLRDGYLAPKRFAFSEVVKKTRRVIRFNPAGDPLREYGAFAHQFFQNKPIGE